MGTLGCSFIFWPLLNYDSFVGCRESLAFQRYKQVCQSRERYSETTKFEFEFEKKSELRLETNCEDNKPVSSFLFCKCRRGGNLNEMSHSCEDHDWAQEELLRFLWRKDPLPWQLLATAKRMSGGEHEQLFGRKKATLILSSYSTNAAPRLSNYPRGKGIMSKGNQWINKTFHIITIKWLWQRKCHRNPW